MSEFIIDCNYQGYTYVGQAYGSFETETGKQREFYNIFVVSPVSDFESDDYHASGLKAEKKKCISADMLNGLTVGDRVNLFFDDKQRVIKVERV